MINKIDIKNSSPEVIKSINKGKIERMTDNQHSDFNEMIHVAVSTAIIKGWHDEDRNIGELIALAHSELSEVLEEFRKPEIDREKVGLELADLIIRVMDLGWYVGFDLKECILKKMLINLERPYKHGKKF